MENQNPEPNYQPQYEPVGVPQAVTTKSPGFILGIISIICALVALVLFPPLFGLAGIILGIIATHRGEKALGISGIILSALFMIIGLLLAFYIVTHPDMLKVKSSIPGAIIESVM